MAWNFFKPNPGDSFIATYTGRYKSVGAFKKPVHLFKNEEKGNFHMWGTAVLDHLLYGVNFGTKVKVFYIGLEKTEESTHKVHNYQIEVLSPPDEEDEKDEV